MFAAGELGVGGGGIGSPCSDATLPARELPTVVVDVATLGAVLDVNAFDEADDRLVAGCTGMQSILRPQVQILSKISILIFK